MKRTLKTMMIAICCMLSCLIHANAGNGKPINVTKLSQVMAHLHNLT